MDWLPLILFSAFIGWILYSNFAKKGRALVMGGEVLKSFEPLDNENSTVSNNIKVHLIQSSGSNGHDIVIEEISKSKLHHSSTRIILNTDQAEGLCKLLNEALEFKNSEV